MNRNNLYLSKRKIYALDYLGGKCVKCGSIENLEVDHTDPSTKSKFLWTVEGGLSIWYLKESLFLIELEKCQLLCHECHVEKTALEKSQRLVHGTISMYSNRNCRCSPCIEAKSIYNREHHVKRKLSK